MTRGVDATISCTNSNGLNPLNVTEIFSPVVIAVSVTIGLEAVGNARTTDSAGAGRVVEAVATVVEVTGTVVVVAVTAAGVAAAGVAAGVTGVAGSVGAGCVTGSAGGVTGAGSTDIPSNTNLIMLVTCRNSGPYMLLELIASKNTPDDVTRGSCG